MQPITFKPAQTYVRLSGPAGRQVREFGTVREVAASRVVMAVADAARRITGTETFNPAYDFGWRLCG